MADAPTLRIALTGGIATGKSRVRRQFEELGVPTIDADLLVHAALESGTPTTARVVERFGGAVLAADGSIDRRALGRVVFSDTDARHDLEQLLHPVVYAAVTEWFVAQRRNGVRLALADIPLLFETGHEAAYDAVIVAACRPEEQLERIVARDGLSVEEAGRRLDAQLPIAQKVAKADFVIWTTGSFEDTARQVEAVARALDQRVRR
jgi:dephospho-CoA kinase